MNPSTADAVLSALAPTFEKEAFARNLDGFFRVRDQFADFASIQLRSDSAAVALNAGVQPLFVLAPQKREPSALRATSEVDCYIRVRLAPPGKADYWVPLGRDLAHVVAEAEKLFVDRGWPFFAFFNSARGLCEALTIEGIRSRTVPEYFRMVTRSRLALVGAKAQLACGDLSRAKALAEYGLSVVGMGVDLKREFKRIIEEGSKPGSTSSR